MCNDFELQSMNWIIEHKYAGALIAEQFDFREHLDDSASADKTKGSGENARGGSAGVNAVDLPSLNPYGVFHLDFDSRIPLEDVREIPLIVIGNDSDLNQSIKCEEIVILALSLEGDFSLFFFDHDTRVDVAHARNGGQVL